MRATKIKTLCVSNATVPITTSFTFLLYILFFLLLYPFIIFIGPIILIRYSVPSSAIVILPYYGTNNTTIERVLKSYEKLPLLKRS